MSPDAVVRRGHTGHGRYRTDITPESAGWDWAGLKILVLPPDAGETVETGSDEMLVLPLSGSGEVTVGGRRYELAGRADVFTGATDHLYVPRRTTLAVTSGSGGRFALATARAERDLPVSYQPATAVRTELRGGGASSRQVGEYAIGNELATDHLMVCEVLTPGGCWSSYPPHKHDEHTETERALEEIYYFEVRPGPDGSPGFALHTTYGSPGRPIDVQATVRDGDVALVPHGYHGPCAAAPGYDLYYLNVMAGPARDRVWKVSFDPAHAWLVDAAAGQPMDPRLRAPADPG